MNRYLQRVFAAYAVAVLAAFLYVPWYGRLQEPGVVQGLILYAPLWQPPATVGYQFYLDYGRIFLEVVSLTLVLLLALVSLWGDDPE